jgi:methyl-accepting chemotaxis protein
MSSPPDNPKRRLFRLLRRGSKTGATGGRSAVEESALWAAHQRAATAVRDSGESAQRIASHVAKQRGTVDALADRARAVSARAQDLSTSFGRIIDAFARLELVALNAGLEGARMGEGAAQALGLVSDEVRAQAKRGSEASRELSTTLAEIGSELLQVNASLDRTRESAAEVAQEAARVGGASADAERALGDIGDRLRKTTGSDPETARAIAEAAEHARALVAALGTLSGKVPQALVVSALRPVLEPLSRMLEGEDDEPTS